MPAGLGAPDALARVLEGTGLEFAYLTPRSIRILVAATVPPHVIITNTSAGEELEEVIVTANRREEKLQDVPMTIQVLSGEQLKELNLNTFNDVIKYTANVTYSGNGPGTGNIFIRGSGFSGHWQSIAIDNSTLPHVALYLDEQSMQFPARNNDVYMVDLERVEVLEGPQGTLFGGGAQAGAIRYITNKPRLDATHADVNAGYGITAGGAPNYSANATLNLPLIADKFAVRAVRFVDRRGGYISNVPATTSFDIPSPSGVRQIGPAATNAILVGPNINPVTYVGFRLSGLYRFMDDWDLLIQQNYQQMQADGSFYAYPFDPNGNALQPNQITAFTPSYNGRSLRKHGLDAQWQVWQPEGRVRRQFHAPSYRRTTGLFQLLIRRDHSTYYDCIGTGAAYFNQLYFPKLEGKPLRCYAPVGAWHTSCRTSTRATRSAQHQ